MPVASSAASPVASIVAVVGGNGADLTDAPNGKTVESLAIADALSATGRNAASDWLYVTTSAGEKGWVKASSIVAFGAKIFR